MSTQHLENILAINLERNARLVAEARLSRPTPGTFVENQSDLGPLWGGFSLTRSEPVGVVGLGSSTMAGTGAASTDGRWFNQVASHLRAVFPNGGTESAVGTLATTRITTPGLHFYNGGIGGTRTTNYLSDTDLTRIANIAPRAVFHMIGSNDVMDATTADDYHDRMVAALDRLDSVVPDPYVNVLFQAHPREGASDTLFGQYREVLRGLANTRANCVFIDMEQPFRSAGVPLPDRLNLLGTDTTHLTQAGHDMMFRIAVAGLGVPVTAGAAGGSGPTSTALQRTTLFTDTFTGTDTALATGRATDNILGGGQANTWTVSGTSAEFPITNAALTRPAAGTTYAVGLPMPVPDYEFTVRMDTVHTNGTLYLVARRASIVLSPSPDDYRLTIFANGGMTLRKRVAGAVTTIINEAGVVTNGSRVGLRVFGNQISVILNGNVRATVTDTSLTAPGWVGISGAGDAYGFVIDNLAVSAILS